MVRSPALVALVVTLVLAGCAGSTVTYGRDDGNVAGTASTVIAPERDSGAKTLDVDVTLPEPPPVFPNQTTVYVQYVFQIKNNGTSPARIRRIDLTSAGGIELERGARTFKKTIEPGATGKIEYMAKAIDIDPNLGVTGPSTVRAEIEFENAEGIQKSVFVRDVGGVGAIGATRRP